MTSAQQECPAPKANTLVGVLVIASAAVCVYAIRRADPDLFGYLAYGRLFVQQGLSVPDPFAYTSSGLHWVSFEYLAQIILWIAYDTFGPVGLIALKCLLGGLAIYFMSIAVRTASDDPIVWAPVFLLCASTVSRFFVFRPQLFTFMLFALYVAVLFRWLLRGTAPLWTLPLAMLLWANTHGGFLAGLAAIALVVALRVGSNLIESRVRIETAFAGTRRLWIVFAICTLVSLFNPQGPRLWQYVLTEVLHDTNRRYIAEWQPPGIESDPWSAVALTFTTVVLLIVGSIAHAQHRRVARLPPWLWLSSCLPVIAFAYLSVRHVPLASLWMAPVITLLASAVWQRFQISTFNFLWRVIGGLALVPLVVTVNHVLANPRPVIATDGSVLGPTHPCTAVAFMRQKQLRGNVYAPLWWGSYITWEMYPDIRVSMDGRNISRFSGDMVAENLEFYSIEATRRDLDTPLRYDTDMLVVPAERPVLAMVRKDLRWNEVFKDSQSSLFVRTDPRRGTPLPLTASEPMNPTGGECASILR